MPSLALPVAALAFCTWCVYLGGLASMQSDCSNAPIDVVNALSLSLPCSEVYRYWWFVMAIEFVCVVGVTLAAATGKLSTMKLSFVGLFAVTTLLYIEASNSFLTLLTSVDYYSSGQQQNRLRTLVAGSIMTATANALMVLVLGINEAPSTAEHEHRSTEPTTTVEKAAATAV